MKNLIVAAALLSALTLLPEVGVTEETVLIPQIDGEWWQVAGDPDLGRYTTPKQQPVDFGVWPAADGTWQLWSCIRGTSAPGKTRLFYRWQGDSLTTKNWKPIGIAMEADPNFGETEGGLQAPYVMKEGSEYLMFYGDWEHIALARSRDGKTFARQLGPDGKSGMFTHVLGANTRDPMVMKVGKTFYLYYTAYPERRGADYVRTSKDLKTWTPFKEVASGGSSGTGPYSAECPFVYYHKASKYYYLFRTQQYGQKSQSNIYRSKDPLDFGVENDKYLVGSLPYAAPEIIDSGGQTYIAALLPSLKGIQIAKLRWAPKP